jgi:type VI protein secretion system component VasK
MTITATPRAVPELAERAARRSLKFLWWIPLSVLVGFLVANRLLSGSWPLTQVILLAVVLATPFGVGAYSGLRAVRLGEAKGESLADEAERDAAAAGWAAVLSNLKSFIETGHVLPQTPWEMPPR